MVWLQFILSTGILTYTAIKLAEYGDIIAVRTRISGLFIGTLLLAGATSLPELLSSINAINLNAPNIAAGNFFGSSMFNMFILSIVDIMHPRQRILRSIANSHSLTASLVTLMYGLIVFFILAGLAGQVGWVGFDSLLIILIYFGGARLIQRGSPSIAYEEIDDSKIPSLRRAVFGFSLAVAVLIVVNPILVRSVVSIAETTGISAGFIGASLLAFVTSFPELITSIAAIRLGAVDLAVGNLFGSNIFNAFSLAVTDFFFVDGRFLSAIDPAFAMAGLLGLILTTMALIGNIARVERRILFVELDALFIIMGYFAGMWFLFAKGIGG